MDLFSGVLPFLHVAETHSFRAAAARLGVTPAAVSKAVAKLEGDLGVVLLERTSRHVALTAEGALYLERCREAVAQLQAGRDLVAGAQRAPHGLLRVTLPPILGRSLLPVVARLSSRHPRLSIQLLLTDRHVRLAEEDVDVALRMGALEDSSLVARTLRRPRWTTVASPAYLARRASPATPADLARHERLVFVSPRGSVREWTFRDPATGRAETLATNGSARLLFDHGELLLDAALEGLGVVQVLDFMSTPHVQAGRLIELLPSFAAEGPELHALTPPRRASIGRVRVFLDALAATLT